MNTQRLEWNSSGFQMGIQAAVARRQWLARGKLLALPDADLVLACHSGLLWLTRAGDHADYIIEPGQRVSLRRGDEGAVVALREGWISVD